MQSSAFVARRQIYEEKNSIFSPININTHHFMCNFPPCKAD